MCWVNLHPGTYFAKYPGNDAPLKIGTGHIEADSYHSKGDRNMRKFFALVMSLALLFSVAITPVYAGGDKNHGDEGQGTVDQGDTGSDTGNAPGDDAQGNQAP